MDSNHTFFQAHTPSSERPEDFKTILHRILDNHFDTGHLEQKEKKGDLLKQLNENEKYALHILIREDCAGIAHQLADEVLGEESEPQNWLEIQDEQGLTALHWAARENIANDVFFQTLVFSSKHPGPTDKAGKTVKNYLEEGRAACAKASKAYSLFTQKIEDLAKITPLTKIDFEVSDAFIAIIKTTVGKHFNLRSDIQKTMQDDLLKQLSGNEKYVFHILLKKGAVQIASDLLSALNEDSLNRPEEASLMHPSLINAKDAEGLTALHWAVRQNITDNELFKDFIEYGGDLAVVDPEGRTVEGFIEAKLKALLLGSLQGAIKKHVVNSDEVTHELESELGKDCIEAELERLRYTLHQYRRNLLIEDPVSEAVKYCVGDEPEDSNTVDACKLYLEKLEMCDDEEPLEETLSASGLFLHDALRPRW